MIIFLLIMIIYDGNDLKMPKEFEDDNKYHSYKVFEMHWGFFIIYLNLDSESSFYVKKKITKTFTLFSNRVF